ncbi:MAG: tetratricopeptide repeat protein [Spirochaetia bacterium]|nr:tetratricopeptide repeat protein [Spirochaetia bacterium]
MIDDLSMLRIAYRSADRPAPEPLPVGIQNLLKEGGDLMRSGDLEGALKALEWAYSMDNQRPEVIRRLVKALILSGDFPRAAELAEDYTYLRPDDTEFVYIAAYCFKKCGKPQRAADFGERVRLRQPHNVKNLINLSDIYRMSGNLSRAMGLIQQALAVEPDNPMAVRRNEVMSGMESQSV